MSGEFSTAVLAPIAAALRRALPAWSIAGDADITLLNVSENATYRIDDRQSGAVRIVRVHRRLYHSHDEIRSEIAWIEALRRDGVVDTPAPLRGVDGDPVQTLSLSGDGGCRAAVAFAFAGGAEPAADADLPAWFERLGAVTARLHDQARRWTPPPAFCRKTWDFQAMFGPRATWGDWRAGVGLDDRGVALIDRALHLIRTRLERFGRAPSRFGLIHGDLRLANLLVEGPDLRVIDFDDCGFSWHLYDFGAAVSFFEHDPIVDRLREAWVRGYRTVADLPQADAAEIPVFVALRRFLLVAWIASHPEVPIARQLGAAYTLGALDMAERLLSDFG
jgi:Ser/Thr protein kinase RdoA (MazF antagonist)